MYYNRANIELINRVKEEAASRGLVAAQTTSRLNGHYLSTVRLYRASADKGHPDRAIWTGREPKDFRDFLTAKEKENENS